MQLVYRARQFIQIIADGRRVIGIDRQVRVIRHLTIRPAWRHQIRQRIHRLLASIRTAEDESLVPKNSLLREFIGGSGYKY